MRTWSSSSSSSFLRVHGRGQCSLRTTRGAARGGATGTVRGEPYRQIVDVERAVAVEVRAAERGTAGCTEVRKPHREIVDPDAVRTVEVERGNGRRSEQRVIPID